MKIAAVLMLLAFPAYANEGLGYVPNWHMVGKEACYNFEDTQKLLEIDSKLIACAVTGEARIQMIAELKFAVDDLQQSLALSKKETELLKENNLKLVQDLNLAIERANKAESGSNPSAGWLVAGGVVLLAGGMLLGAYLLPRK